MYLCCWLTYGPAITLLLYFVNIRVHLYKGMILQLPPCDIWQVTKLKFLDMYFNQDYIKTAPCAWTFSVHMSRGLGKCCRAVILIITGVVKVKGTGKEVWSVCECCAASLATPTSCCAQTSDNRWHTQRDAQMFTPLLTVAPTQTKYAYVCCSDITPVYLQFVCFNFHSFVGLIQFLDSWSYGTLSNLHWMT